MLVPLSVYVFIILAALGAATIAVGAFHLVMWAWGWARFLWAERDWRLQFKRSKGR